MSDPTDVATLAEESFTQEAIYSALASSGAKKLAFTGFCHNCRSPVAKPKRFCDEECANEYEYIESRKRANGLA